MKRVTLEATDENVLASIKNNNYNRNSDVAEFVQAIDSIEGNMFISLDARWGEGKTFFVRQVEKTLEYQTRKNMNIENQPDKEKAQKALDILKESFTGTVLDNMNLTQSYLPIYYNAWQYDNHDDPLMSLVFNVIKNAEVYLDTKLKRTVGDRLKDLISALSMSVTFRNLIEPKYGEIQASINGEKIIDAIKTNDILDNIVLTEEIRFLVKQLLDDAITAKAQRLVIFVDELDRCRPTYAIEMLERIKHYFEMV